MFDWSLVIVPLVVALVSFMIGCCVTLHFERIKYERFCEERALTKEDMLKCRQGMPWDRE
jgi:hypothetical protein